MAFLRDLFSDRYARFAPLFIRISVGVHLIYGTQDNVLSWAQMLEFRDFLAQHGFPLPLVCAVASVAAQLLAGVAYVIGYQTRWAALLMVVNFLVAIFGVHVAQGHPYHATFPAIMMLAAALFLLLNGPGAWSLDSRRRDHAR
jgi:putative oxidoreductase